ncbi:hypothetical protein JIN77_15965 [Verrucomicrobiaceae bacterium R5-34]|nr:hypothetical protein [Verrucomicrobiaceae bacterium R5-34]
MKKLKFIVVSLVCVLSSCVHEKGYNPTIWNYSVNSINKLDKDVHYFRVEKKGYNRLLVNCHNLWSGTTRGYSFMNLPVRGEVYASWKVNGVKYGQIIDLDVLKLRSFKGDDDTITFQFNRPDRVDVSVLRD